MNDLNRELDELTGAATRYVVTPPVAVVRHRAVVRRRAQVASAMASAVAVAGIVAGVFVLGADREQPDIAPAASTTAPASPAPSATSATDGASVSSSTALPPPVTSAPAAESAPPPTTSSGATSQAPSFPPFAKELTHGSKYWAVFLVVSKDGNDPRYAAARDELTAAGYAGFDGEARNRPAGDLGCDAGAFDGLVAAGIALDPAVYYTGMAVYFDTKAAAEQFVEAFQPGVVGTVQVTYMCAD